MTQKSSLEIGQTIIDYYPAWMEGERVACLDFPIFHCDKDTWTPSIEFGKYERKRGSVLSLVRQSKTVKSFWLAQTPGANELHEVPNYHDPEYEILRSWKWTGKRWMPLRSR